MDEATKVAVESIDRRLDRIEARLEKMANGKNRITVAFVTGVFGFLTAVAAGVIALR